MAHDGGVEPEALERAGEIARARGMEADGHARLGDCGPERVEAAVVEGAAAARVRAHEDAAHAELPHGAAHLAHGRAHVLQRQAGDADQPTRVRAAVVGEPVVVDAAARLGERRVLDRLQEEPH